MEIYEVERGNKRKKRKFYLKKNKRKDKLIITFDENARREFLTGFQKRKLERKTKAMEEFEKQLKMERKRIKTEAKEAYKKLLMAQKPVGELDLQSEQIDMGTHLVSVTELSATELAKKNNWIGVNEVQYEGNELENNCTQSDEEFKLEGMELKTRKNESHKKKSFLKSCKDIKKAIRQQVTISVQNSKIFQLKSKIEKIKHIKRKKKEEKKRKKLKKLKMQ